MKFSELIEHCVTCIKGFNPVIKTIDSHADEFISQVSVVYSRIDFANPLSCLDSSRIPMRRSLSSKCFMAALDIKNSSE